MKLLNTILLLFFFSLSFAQSPHLIWEKTIGDSKNDEAYQIILTSDNHFLVVGYTQPEGRYDLDLFLLKLNSNGDLIWKKNYGTQKVEIGYAIAEDSKGDFIVVGKANTTTESAQTWVLKTDTNGNIIWDKKYGNKHHDVGKSVLITNNSQIIIGGNSEGVASKFNHANWLVLDEKGNKIKEKTYGGDHFKTSAQPENSALASFKISKGETCNKIIPSRNGGFLFVGSTITKAKKGLATDGWLVRLDGEGQLLWDKNIGAIGGDDILDVIENENGDIIAIGEYYNKLKGRMDIWFTRFDKNGNVLIEKTFGEKNFNSGKSGLALNQNEILICGFTSNKSITNYETILHKDLSNAEIDKMVKNGWEKFASKNKEGEWKIILQKIIPLTDKQKTIKTDRDIWIGKVNMDGVLIWEKNFGGDDDEEAFSIIKDKDGNFILAGYTRSKGNGLKDIWILKIGNP